MTARREWIHCGINLDLGCLTISSIVGPGLNYAFNTSLEAGPRAGLSIGIGSLGALLFAIGMCSAKSYFDSIEKEELQSRIQEAEQRRQTPA